MKSVVEIMFKNAWDYFIVLTISTDKFGNCNDLETIKEIGSFLYDYSLHRSEIGDFKYFVIPERRDGKSVYFHGIISGVPLKDLATDENGYIDFLPFGTEINFQE